MKTIRLKFDFDHGPIWQEHYDSDKGIWYTGIDVIDNDIVLNELNQKAQTLYTSFYSFDGETACDFDKQGFERKKPELKELLCLIINRLNKINDGTFEVVDDGALKIFVTYNRETIKTIKEAEKGVNLSKAYDNVDDLMSDLNDDN